MDALSKRKIHNKFFLEYNSLLRKFEKSKFHQNYYSDIRKLKEKKINHCNIFTNLETTLSEDITTVTEYYMYDAIVKNMAMFTPFQHP